MNEQVKSPHFDSSQEMFQNECLATLRRIPTEWIVDYLLDSGYDVEPEQVLCEPEPGNGEPEDELERLILNNLKDAELR